MSDSTPDLVPRTYIVEIIGSKAGGEKVQISADTVTEGDDGGWTFELDGRVVAFLSDVRHWWEAPAD